MTAPRFQRHDVRAPDAAQRAALRDKRVHARLRRAMMRCRAGAVPSAGVWYGPGSAKQHFMLHRAWDTGVEVMTAPLLAIRGLRAAYGRIEALKGVDLTINAGEIVALIGANGAGKSTLMMTVFGKPRARSGQIEFDGRDITDVPTHEIARMRIAQSPEGRRIFPRMSVAENLQMGADATDSSESDRAAGLERVLTLFPRLKERMTQRGGTLSGGEQQMLAIGRALMSRPRLLMLDEPSLGLAPLIARQIFDAIRTLNRQDALTVLIVEQNANHALRLAHRGYVMVNGLITLDGTGAELLRRPEIRAAYLEGGRRG